MASFTAQPSTAVFHGLLNELDGGTLLYTFEHTILSNANPPAYTVEYWINSSFLLTNKLSSLDVV